VLGDHVHRFGVSLDIIRLEYDRPIRENLRKIVLMDDPRFLLAAAQILLLTLLD